LLGHHRGWGQWHAHNNIKLCLQSGLIEFPPCVVTFSQLPFAVLLVFGSGVGGGGLAKAAEPWPLQRRVPAASTSSRSRFSAEPQPLQRRAPAASTPSPSRSNAELQPLRRRAPAASTPNPRGARPISPSNFSENCTLEEFSRFGGSPSVAYLCGLRPLCSPSAGREGSGGSLCGATGGQ
jgi:hypothetical protein